MPPPPRPRPQRRRTQHPTSLATTPSQGKADSNAAAGKRRLDRHWLIALVAGICVLLLVLLLFVAAGLGLAVASGMFSSGSGYESSQSTGLDSSPSFGQSVPSASSGGSESDEDSSEAADAAPSDDSTDDPATDSGDSTGSSSSSSSGGSSSGNEKVYAIPGGQFFGIETEGRSFVYVIDSSSSMNGTPFQRAKLEIVRSIKSLSNNQSFYVVFFSDDEFPMYHPSVVNALAPATQENVNKATLWVNSFQSDGGTDPQQALLRALKLAPDAIYLLTDGEFDPGTVHLAANSNVRVNTVSFINRSGEALLKEIAQKTGGVYLFVP